MAPTPAEIPGADPDPAWARALAASHLALIGQAIAPWSDPCPIVSHGAEDDPIFRWANPAALVLWQTSWEAFTRMPSRLSAEEDPQVQDDRSRYLAEAQARGYVTGYQGIRISALGQRFRIRDTVLWTLRDPDGKVLGQAARILRVEPL